MYVCESNSGIEIEEAMNIEKMKNMMRRMEIEYSIDGLIRVESWLEVSKTARINARNVNDQTLCFVHPGNICSNLPSKSHRLPSCV